MHQADRPAGRGGEREARRVVGERRDVVEEVGAGVEGGPRDGGIAGVDRDRQREALGAQRRDDRDDAGDLLGDRHRIGARAGSNSPPMSRMSAPAAASARACASASGRREVQAAVGEAVGRDVQDAHDPRPVEREAADRRARRREARGDLGGQRRGRHQPRRRAAAVLGDLGEPERAAGERQRAGRAAARRSAAIGR